MAGEICVEKLEADKMYVSNIEQEKEGETEKRQIEMSIKWEKWRSGSLLGKTMMRSAES